MRPNPFTFILTKKLQFQFRVKIRQLKFLEEHHHIGSGTKKHTKAKFKTYATAVLTQQTGNVKNVNRKFFNICSIGPPEKKRQQQKTRIAPAEDRLV
jgi:hypothetical protein